MGAGITMNGGAAKRNMEGSTRLPASNHRQVRLVGGTQNARLSLRRLAKADFLHGDETQLMLPNDRSPAGDAEVVTAMLEQIAKAPRRMHVPRRILRSRGGGWALGPVAPRLGPPLRDLSPCAEPCGPAGQDEARWLTEVLQVSSRQV